MNKKLDYSLAPPEFDDVIEVLQHSAETGKYGRNDWLEGINFDSENNYSSSARHWRDYREGVRSDAENGLHPLLMVACRALMQYTLDKRNYKEYIKRLDEECNHNQIAGLYEMHPQYCLCKTCYST